MSTSGIYGYHPKVEHPHHIFPQMESASHQPSFFFGASQVPVSLGHIHGHGITHPLHGIDTGFRTPHRFTMDKHKLMSPSFTVDGSVNGKGIRTTMDKHNKIMLPQYMSTLQK
jgi:hypothetical protein